jgi:hypothetical protein
MDSIEVTSVVRNFVLTARLTPLPAEKGFQGGNDTYEKAADINNRHSRRHLGKKGGSLHGMSGRQVQLVPEKASFGF